MSKKTKELKEKEKAAQKLRNKIEEKRKEKELFLSNRANSRLLNKLNGSTYRKPVTE